MSSDPSNLQDAFLGDETFVLIERTVNPYIVNFHEARGFRAEQIRGLRNKLLVMNHEDMPRTLAITSAIQGEGKTVTAINLAIALAELEAAKYEWKHVQSELEDYRRDVVDHFSGTSEMLTSLTRQYRVVYDHLSEGAKLLCPEGSVRIDAGVEVPVLPDKTEGSEPGMES